MMIETNETNGTRNGVNGHTNGANGYQTSSNTNINGNGCYGDSPKASFEPIAICGMACRLPGGVNCPKELWEFLIEGQDGRVRTPKSRFNIDGYYSPVKRAGTTNTEYGYFLDESNDLSGLDISMFPMTRLEAEWLDPQQRMMLEVARESLDDAGEVNWKGSNTGVYIGSFGQDWYDILNRDSMRHSAVSVIASHDFMISERVSHDMDLKGPSMTIKTACSSALIGLNEACMAIAKGDCESAIVGGTNLILAPDLVTRLTNQGILSPDGSCKTFSSEANGYARGEAIVSVYVKSLSAALRDGNPIRSVITGSASNFDGRTNPLTTPSAAAQEALIRRTYEVAGVSDFCKTALFECHGTGTAAGDPIETEAIAAVFGDKGVYLGAIKPNLGHSEGASGLTAVLKATLSLEQRTIPPNIKYAPLNPDIPFERAKLSIPEQATPWPAGRDERVSINSFGVGGSNAHVIVESAASYFSSRKGIEVVPQKQPEDDRPQLMVFSAMTAQSLKQMEEKYQSLLEMTASVNLPDLAYTLANRREHLPYRSFAIATKDKFELPTALASESAGSQIVPTLVMVFTGQGASWPQLGRELFLSNSTYARRIKSLDTHLQFLGADWSLEEELLKPTRTSRVYEAEFSQPLCTAVQLALVDTLASVGVKPAAVLGHSSGEIAAAYTAGALNAEEAITVAFCRGTATKGQTQRGGMAAVGLGWDEVQKFLLPGVITACDNSPNSVTISGDADQLETVLANIKEAQPDISATVLKVEKAYHSHHMLALGPDYHSEMTAHGVVGKSPSIPFFSSVKGQLLDGTKVNQLGPSYWQANLEQPVLFKSAVQEIVRSKDLKNKVFLEVGPHSALAGPLRQILTSESNKSAYVPTLVRRQNNFENLLQAIGKLYALNVSIDFESLVPGGSVVSDLPSYPWDHSRKYWFETRVAKAWREREHLEHTLLGAQLPESTDLEPVWRNFLHAETTPWIVDHKIGESIVFPFAGYVSIAAEAAKQVSGIEDGVSFRDMLVNTALVLDDDKPTEIVTTMRRHRLTDSLNSEWWEFNVSSFNGHAWTKHCSGQVRGEALPKTGLEDAKEQKPLPREVDCQRWYDCATQEGLVYGPRFATLRNVQSSTGWPHQATGSIRNNGWGDEAQYHLHPVVLDTLFQLISISINDGIGHAYRRIVASRLEFLTIYRSNVDKINISVTSQPTDAGYVGEGDVTADGKTILKIRGSHAILFEENEASNETMTPITARCEWVPHIDFQKDLSNLITPPQIHVEFAPQLAELAQMSIYLANRTAQGIDTQTHHLIKYKEWLRKKDSSDLQMINAKTLSQCVDSILERFIGTPAESAAKAIDAISKGMEALFRDEKTGLEILNTDGHLDRLTEFLTTQNDLDYIRCIANSQPNIRILEVGAGLGGRSSKILNSLTLPNGQPLYSKYVITDASGLLDAAKANLSGFVNTEFQFLDVNANIPEQGLEDQKFDLIIAVNVINTSADVCTSLRNLREVLAPGGRLLLEEPRPGLSWVKFALATLPGFWAHARDSDMIEEPFLSPARWEIELRAAGFEDVTRITSAPEHEMNSVLVARHLSPKKPAKRITLLRDDSSPEPLIIVHELKSRGYNIDHCSLREVPPPDQDVLALLEEEGPFFETMNSTKLEEFRSFVHNMNRSGLLWVTRFSSIHCTNPRYGQVIGLFRVLRSEMGINVATVETEKITSTADATRVADVLAKFQMRDDNDAMGPDCEYTVHNDQTFVNRVFPFSLDEELQMSQESDEAIISQSSPGNLSTINWTTKQVAAPKDDEIEIEVYASGLNFRDILVGMKIIPGRHEPKFGYEAAGVVRRVSPKVTKLSVGDRVVVFGRDAFSTTMTCPEIPCEKLPDSISFVEGACIGTIFLTAVYGLSDLGHLSRGQSVLIHSGAGGVGLAAIQVARMLGAEIYTTVGSERKVEYLMETCGIPRDRIFNSRNTSFVDDLLRVTNGKGVDVVLNSLSGELLHATWKCVAKFGTMVEIGKRDLLGNAQLDMAPFLANRNYCCLDMDQMTSERPEVTSRLLRFIMDCFARGIFKPVRVDQVFSAPAIQESFRYMQQGKHIGKIVLEIRDPMGKLLVKDVDARKRTTLELDGDASYLLVGGLGGLGRSISVWMVQHGARNLTYLSRSAGGGKHDAKFVREIESMGCSVQLVRGDVTKAEDVARAVDGTTAPLKGIVQMSMLLRDQMFDDMSFEDWNTVTAPKVEGTWNLHNVTVSRGLSLNFFLLFSSLSGVLGQIGQANYASANTFLDAFVQYRRSMNLPCSAIDLGAMEGVGYLSENQELLRKMQGTGWLPVQEIQLLEVMELGMRSPSTIRTQDTTTSFILGVAPTRPLSHPESSVRLRRDVRMAIYHNIGGDATQAGSAPDGLRAFLASAKKDPSILRSDESTELLAMEIGKKLFGLLLIMNREVDTSTSPAELGLDSLVATELRAWWKLSLGFDINTLEMLSMGTLEALGKRAADGLITLYDV